MPIPKLFREEKVVEVNDPEHPLPRPLGNPQLAAVGQDRVDSDFGRGVIGYGRE
jgi:hypothetical protein